MAETETKTRPEPSGSLIKPTPAAEAFYSEVLKLMAESGIPFLVSGTYALASYHECRNFLTSKACCLLHR